MAFVGVLMLETQFPRPLGDIGNPQSFAQLGLPVRYQVVAGASPARVLGLNDPNRPADQPDAALLALFVDAAQKLEAQGAALVTTSCGFLAQFQTQLQHAVSVPVVTSSLLWVARLQVPSAILTIDAQALTAAHLAGAGALADTPVGGVRPGCEFQSKILGNLPTMDIAQAQRDVVDAAAVLVARCPVTHTIVLECTNMAPYSKAVANATGRRVEHILTLIEATWKQ